MDIQLFEYQKSPILGKNRYGTCFRIQEKYDFGSGHIQKFKPRIRMQVSFNFQTKDLDLELEYNHVIKEKSFKSLQNLDHIAILKVYRAWIVSLF